MRRALALVTILGAAWAATAAADGGGPSPGPMFGPQGLVDRSAATRYVALIDGKRTLVESISTRGGQVLHWKSLRGLVGIPMVAYDGTLGGLSRDGQSLVLASPQYGASTRFVLLDQLTLRVRAQVRLRGSWAFDALSPDGSLMYLIQYLGKPGSVSQPYAVRLFDWRSRKLVSAPISDAREWSVKKMSGMPITRAGAPNGWAYTLYMRPGKRPFVHALDTVHRQAYCVFLPWRDSDTWIQSVKLRVRSGMLTLNRDGHTIARMDRKTLEVTR
jgi:hypothetical protein